MAKFCGHCGSRMDDSVKVCGNCGTPFSGASSALNFVDPEKKVLKQQKLKKKIKLGIGIAVLFLIAVIVINVISAHTGHNGLLRKVMSAYKDYDIDTLVSMSSDAYYYGTADYAEEYFENAVGYSLDAFEAEVGHKYTIGYAVIETYSLSNRNYDSMIEALSWTFPKFDSSIIEKIVVAEVEVTAKQGNESSSMVVRVTMTKEDGSWRVLYIN